MKSHHFSSGRIRRYAIIRDADEDVDAALAEIRDMLKSLDEPMPPNGGVTARKDGRAVGLYLIPGNDRTGDLEALLLQTAGGELMQRAEKFVADVANSGGHTDHLSKRIAQVYLAVGMNPLCAGVGWAASRDAFDLTGPALDGLREFLHQFSAS